MANVIRAKVIREYPKGRTEAFTDGVIAIVITLLVLDLGVRAGAEDDLLQAILDEWPSYLAYFVSFFTVGAFWLRHHAITSAISRVDSAFIRLNLLMIFFLSFLPFPTKLITDTYMDHEGISTTFDLFLESESDERVAVVFYGIVLLLAALSLNLLWRYAARRRRLLKADTPHEEVRELDESLAPSLVGYVVAILVGLAFPRVAVVLYLLMAVLLALPLGTFRAALRRA